MDVGGGGRGQSPRSPPPLLLCLQNMQEVQIQLHICLIVRTKRKRKNLAIKKNGFNLERISDLYWNPWNLVAWWKYLEIWCLVEDSVRKLWDRPVRPTCLVLWLSQSRRWSAVDTQKSRPLCEVPIEPSDCWNSDVTYKRWNRWNNQ